MSTQKLDIFNNFREIAETKNIPLDSVVECFVESVKLVLERIDPDGEVTFDVDIEQHKFDITKTRIVVSQEEYNENVALASNSSVIYIPITEAKKTFPRIKEGDEKAFPLILSEHYALLERLINSQFSMLLSSLYKNMIFQKYSKKIGEIVRARITSKGKQGFNMLILDDKTTAFMPLRFTSPKLLNGKDQSIEIDAYVENALESTKNAQVILSTVSNRILYRELENEIPEIHAGIIEIVNISRLAGNRSKIAIRKVNQSLEGLNELGAIIGSNANRIVAISQKLDNEKLDIIPYSDNQIEYIINALSPAKVLGVVKLENGQHDVIVPDLEMTLAIGKLGSNVSLAADLTNTKINIINYTDALAANRTFEFNGNITIEEAQAQAESRVRPRRSNFTNSQYQNRRPRTNENKQKQMFETVDFDAIRSEIMQFNNVILDQADADQKSEIEKSIAKQPLKKFKSEQQKQGDFDYDVFNEIENIKSAKSSKEDLRDIERSMANFTTDKSLLEGLGDIDLDDIDEDW